MVSSETSTTPVSLQSRICKLSSAWSTLYAIYSRDWGLAKRNGGVLQKGYHPAQQSAVQAGHARFLHLLRVINTAQHRACKAFCNLSGLKLPHALRRCVHVRVRLLRLQQGQAGGGPEGPCLPDLSGGGLAAHSRGLGPRSLRSLHAGRHQPLLHRPAFLPGDLHQITSHIPLKCTLIAGPLATGHCLAAASKGGMCTVATWQSVNNHG